ncbi:hypothetical protein B9Z19DRAFT_1134975 [Tuber borchii]|uniref:Cleavage and polyadenylation specificity factor 2 C-terminal domain-containing protein n=1 Tax=Tuber borchii TaxID=42251 RepID=A0A2T6ZDN5_TUBBO|nr:hypothetical protein B9Z19DRAFT_1134975 [Tuber borchii]
MVFKKSSGTLTLTFYTLIRGGKTVKLSKSPEAEPKESGSKVEQSSYLFLDELRCALAAPTMTVAQPIHIGDIRLADLRRVLLEDGLTAELRGEETLLIDGVVVGVGSRIIEDGGGGMLRGAVRNEKANLVEVRKRMYRSLTVAFRN